MKAIAIALLTSVCLASTAAAQSKHERVEVKPLVDGGETVGIKLKLTLRPHPTRDGSTVRIGIGRANWAAFSTEKNTIDHRAAASDIGFGYAMYHQEINGITTNAPREVELEIPYTALPGINPGDSIDIFTTWNNTPGHPAVGSPTYWHVWGIDQNDKKLIFKTPPGKVRPYGKQPKASMKEISAAQSAPEAITVAPVSSTVIAPLAPPAAAAAPKATAKAKAPKATKPKKLTTPKSATAAQAKPAAAKKAAAKKTPTTKKAGK